MYQKFNTEIKAKLIHSNDGVQNIELLQRLEIQLSSGNWMEIPVGFVSDGASVPRCLWSLWPPFTGRPSDIGAIVHDFMYRKGYYIDADSKRHVAITRKSADYEMFFQQRVNGDGFMRAFPMHLAVLLFGQPTWNKYRNNVYE